MLDDTADFIDHGVWRFTCRGKHRGGIIIRLFTNWMAGGGIKPGVSYGQSDEWSYKPADAANPTYCYDIHATVLKLLGIEHTKLTYRHNGIDRRLTDVHGRVIGELLA